MVGRTHDLVAFTILNYAFVVAPLPHMTVGTLLIAVGANMFGGVAPDIDQPTAELWNRIPAGSVIGRLVCPLLGSHRLLSHSLMGVVLFGFLSEYLLKLASSFLIVDNYIVWLAFMIGFISHLLADTITKEGVPWLFPIPIRFGIPPVRVLRMRSGGFLEKFIIFPGLLLLNGYFVYSYYGKYLDFLRHYIH